MSRLKKKIENASKSRIYSNSQQFILSFVKHKKWEAKIFAVCSINHYFLLAYMDEMIAEFHKKKKNNIEPSQ